MTTFSQPQSYSITSSNLTHTDDTITIDLSSAYSSPIDTVTLTSTIISNGTSYGEYNIVWENTEWVNGFPEWERIQNMCDEYPGLKIAFEKFKTTYKLVKDDYDTPKDKRKTP